MSLPKTRRLFLDVARQLFAQLGYEGTTMNRIAQESKKGRRTLYTYFNNKNEIFAALIEQELERLYRELKSFVESPQRADRKLMSFVYLRLAAVKEVVERNGSLEAEFFRDITLVERTRLRFDRQETLLIQRILREGVSTGVMAVEDTRFAAMLIHSALKGLEVPYIRGYLGRNEEELKQHYSVVKQFVLEGIVNRTVK